MHVAGVHSTHSKGASKMSMMGLHGQDRLLMVVMSDDGNAWRMTACKQKPNMVIAMVTNSYFIQPEHNGGKMIFIRLKKKNTVISAEYKCILHIRPASNVVKTYMY